MKNRNTKQKVVNNIGFWKILSSTIVKLTKLFLDHWD